MSADFKVAVVTGAGRGIARNIALALARSGYAVAALDIDEDGARATAEEAVSLGGQAIACKADISDEAQVERAFKTVQEHWGRIDLLVNAAGSHGQGFRKTHETPVDEWRHVVASNLTGYFLCAKHCLPGMMARKSGRIINFSSNAGRNVSPLLGASYTAAKAGVIGLTRHLANEYAPHGILVNTIAPGPVDGERVDKLLEDRGGSKELARSIPLGRLATEEDVTDVVLFLASDASRFMTGAILDVNGGYVLA